MEDGDRRRCREENSMRKAYLNENTDEEQKDNQTY